MGDKGGSAKRWVLLGTDYVYPRTTNKILRYFLKSKGVAKRTSWRSTRIRAQRLPNHRQRREEVCCRQAHRGGFDHQR